MGRPKGGTNRRFVGECWYVNPDNNQWYRVRCRREGHNYVITPVTKFSDHYREPWVGPDELTFPHGSKMAQRLCPLTHTPPRPA